jgi:hypothetical protein
VCEAFEQSTPILNDGKQSRITRWNAMIRSKSPIHRNIKVTLKQHSLNLRTVPQIAVGLFKKINNDVHSDFEVSRDRLIVVVRDFSQDELKLVKAIVTLYPITDVEYIKNKFK